MSCAICYDRCYRLGSTNISPVSSSGWFEKRLLASWVRQDCADQPDRPRRRAAIFGGELGRIDAQMPIAE
jgi:hypothetical protein